MRKEIKILGKTIPIWILAAISMVGIGSATLLSYYGRMTTTVSVSQSIILTGDSCTSNECSSSISAVGSETAFSDSFNIKSNTVNNLTVKFSNTCLPNCDGVTITNRVELSVVGFNPSITDGFETANYKATDYTSPVGSLSGLNDITYSFKITENGFGDDTLAPYVVIVGSGIGPYNVAVYDIPDGSHYATSTEYTGTVDSNSLFHVPGDTGTPSCTQASPCTLAQLKSKYLGASISKIRYALGAWPNVAGPTIKASMGLSKINGVQAEHKSVTIYGGTTVPTVEKYDFDALITPGTYTIYTTVGSA